MDFAAHANKIAERIRGVQSQLRSAKTVILHPRLSKTSEDARRMHDDPDYRRRVELEAQAREAVTRK